MLALLEDLWPVLGIRQVVSGEERLFEVCLPGWLIVAVVALVVYGVVRLAKVGA